MAGYICAGRRTCGVWEGSGTTDEKIQTSLPNTTVNVPTPISDALPASREFLLDALHHVAFVADSFVQLDDEVFRVSWQRLYPLTKEFEAIDFRSCARRISELDKALLEMVHQLPDSSEEAPVVLTLLKDYCDGLRAAMSCLKFLCENLDEKLRQSRDYGWLAYRRNVRSYRRASKASDDTANQLNHMLGLKGA